jgi:hypothetical protein
MMEANNLTALQCAAAAKEWEQVEAEIGRLVEAAGPQKLEFLISLLNQSAPAIRNGAALWLRDLADNRALVPLLAAIRNPITLNANGTMVWALHTLDCRHYLVELFEIIFYQGYEAKVMGMMVLDEQEFEFSFDDLHNIKRQWDACQAQPALCPNFYEQRESIQDFVDGFMAYFGE